MTSPKLPLFGGIIFPLHNNVANPVPTPPIPNLIAMPTDKALQPAGIQDIFEVHLWLIPGGDEDAQRYWLYAFEDNNPAVVRTIWSGSLTDLGIKVRNVPIKILDGYPIRGNITLGMLLQFNTGVGGMGDEYPIGAQAFGYAYRVGQGPQHQGERRFIGEPSSDGGLTVGMPLVIPQGDQQRVHTFQPNKIDEISLAFVRNVAEFIPPPPPPPSIDSLIGIRFEDANNNQIIPGHQVNINILAPNQNYFRDPQSVYTIYQAVFGTTFYTTLDHITVLVPGPVADPEHDVYVHGYFNRR